MIDQPTQFQNPTQIQQPVRFLPRFVAATLRITSITCGPCPSNPSSRCTQTSFSEGELELKFYTSSKVIAPISCPGGTTGLDISIDFWGSSSVSLHQPGNLAPLYESVSDISDISDAGLNGSVTLLHINSGACLCLNYQVETNPFFLTVAYVRELVILTVAYLSSLLRVISSVFQLRNRGDR